MLRFSQWVLSHDEAIYRFFKAIQPLPDVRRQGSRPSPFSAPFLIYIAMWFSHTFVFGSPLWLRFFITVLAFCNFLVLRERIYSVGLPTYSLWPSFADFRSYVRLLMYPLPSFVLVIASSLLGAMCFHWVATNVAAFFGFSFGENWETPAFVHSNMFFRIDTMALHLIGGRVLFALWSVQRPSSVFKKKFGYGSYWTAIANPAVSGIGYFLALQWRWNMIVWVCFKLSPVLGHLIVSPSFWIAHSFFGALTFFPIWTLGHLISHKPRFWGLVHYNHHLQNACDELDGLGQGLEEALYTNTLLCTLVTLPGLFSCVNFIWVFALSYADGNVHDPVLMQPATKYQPSQLGYYNARYLMHVYHHLLPTTHFSLGPSELSRLDFRSSSQNEARRALAPFEIQSHEIVSRWMQKMALDARRKDKKVQ